MILFVLLFLLGSSLEITARDWQWWMGSQTVIKVAIGTAQSVLIVYVAEIAPFQLRGVAIAAYQLFLASGQLVGSIATQIMEVTAPGQWKPLIASEFVFTGVSDEAASTVQYITLAWHNTRTREQEQCVVQHCCVGTFRTPLTTSSGALLPTSVPARVSHLLRTTRR